MTLKNFTDALNIADLSKFVQFVKKGHRYGTPSTKIFQKESSAQDSEFFIAEILTERLVKIKLVKFCSDGKGLITLDESVTYDIDASLSFVEALK